MAIDYEKYDNWERALKKFAKILGKDDYNLVKKKLKLFDGIEKLIKESDKAAKKAVKISKKDKHAIIPKDVVQTLVDNNKELSKLEKKVTKLLEKTIDKAYEDAIEDLMGELELYTSVYRSFTNIRMDDKKKEFEDMKRRLDLTSKFLQPGSFDKAFQKGHDAMQAVAKDLRKFNALKDASDDDIRDLYKSYNDNLPGNSNGMRSVTTFLKAFIDMEVYFEKYKISNSSFKKLKLHPELKDYDTFRKYLKGAAVFIKRLTPWATGSNRISSTDVEAKVTEGKDAAKEDVASRLMEAKRNFIQAKTFFAKLF